MKVLNEMIEFVNSNFEVIKNNFYQVEKEIIEDLDEDVIEIEEMIACLEGQMSGVFDTDSLIELINERSIGVDLNDDDECEELFEQIEMYFNN
jgi:hypothetical protein